MTTLCPLFRAAMHMPHAPFSIGEGAAAEFLYYKHPDPPCQAAPLPDAARRLLMCKPPAPLYTGESFPCMVYPGRKMATTYIAGRGAFLRMALHTGRNHQCSRGRQKWLQALIYSAACVGGAWLAVRFILPWTAPFILAFAVAALLEGLCARSSAAAGGEARPPRC